MRCIKVKQLDNELLEITFSTYPDLEVGMIITDNTACDLFEAGFCVLSDQ